MLAVLILHVSIKEILRLSNNLIINYILCDSLVFSRYTCRIFKYF